MTFFFFPLISVVWFLGFFFTFEYRYSDYVVLSSFFDRLFFAYSLLIFWPVVIFVKRKG